MALRVLVLPLLLFVTGPSSAPSSGDARGVISPDVTAGTTSAMPFGAWPWPVTGPVIRAFDTPTTPFGAGHRGIDVAVPVGTAILAPEAGTVSFAGRVGGELFVTLDHGGGLASTYSWLSATVVREGDVVALGQTIGSTGSGHPGAAIPHLHLGMKLDGAYLDPLEVLGPLGVQDFIRLVPLAA